MIFSLNTNNCRLTSLWQTPKLSPQESLGRIHLRPSSRNWNSKSSTKCLGKSVYKSRYVENLVFTFLSCRVKVREGRFGELTEILAWYEYINDVILDHLDDEIKSTNKSGVWRYLISFKVSSVIIQMFRIRFLNISTFSKNPSESSSRDWKYRNCFRLWHPISDNWKCYSTEFYQVRHWILQDAGIHFSGAGTHFLTQPRYVEHDTLIWEYLNSSIHLAPYLEKKFRKIYEGEAYKFYRQR